MLQIVVEPCEIRVADIVVALQVGKTKRHVPVERLRAAGEHELMPGPGQFELTELGQQHAGIGMQARIGTAGSNFVLAERSGILLAPTIIEQLDCPYHQFGVMPRVSEQRAHHGCCGMHAPLFLENACQQESCGGVIRSHRKYIAQQ